MLAAILAAAPVPGPPVPLPPSVGPVGEWFLPAVIIGMALGLDASAAGAAAKRDRLAAGLTYTGALGLIAVYQWADEIQGWFGESWSWRVFGSAISVLAHAGLVVVLLGEYMEKTKRIAAFLGPKVGVDGKMSSQVGKINTKLHLWATAAACSYVLARGDAGALPGFIGTSLTGISGALGMWVVHRLGG